MLHPGDEHIQLIRLADLLQRLHERGTQGEVLELLPGHLGLILLPIVVVENSVMGEAGDEDTGGEATDVSAVGDASAAVGNQEHSLQHQPDTDGDPNLHPRQEERTDEEGYLIVGIEQEHGAHEGGYGSGGPDHHYHRTAPESTGSPIGQAMRQSGQEAAQEVNGEEEPLPHPGLQLGSDQQEEEHVEDQMREPGVQEHVGDEGVNLAQLEKQIRAEAEIELHPAQATQAQVESSEEADDEDGEVADGQREGEFALPPEQGRDGDNDGQHCNQADQMHADEESRSRIYNCEHPLPQSMEYDSSLPVEDCPQVYRVDDDSILLVRSLDVREGERVLELGCGTGVLSIHCAKEGAEVTAVDVNPHAVECARRNAARCGLPVEVMHSNLYDKVEGRFDLIAFNLPYLPVEEEGELEKAWSGGSSGVEPLERMLAGAEDYLAPGGRMAVVVSSLMNQEALDSLLSGWEVEVKGRLPLFFEELRVLVLRIGDK